MQPQSGFVVDEVSSEYFCDGIPHCTVNLEDELDPICSDRFQCAASGLISIAADQICDGTINCDDGSDEANSTCPDRFHCPSRDGAKVLLFWMLAATNFRL